MIEVSDNDIEYYERKVVRMEQDICLLQQQLNRVRLKLRSAEDYEIKYRILMKNNEVDLQRTKIEVSKLQQTKMRQKIASALKQNDQRWSKVNQNLEKQLRKQMDEKIRVLSDQLQNSNKKVQELSQKKEEMEFFSFKIRKFEKDNQALQLQLTGIKAACQKQKNEQLNALRNQLNTGFRQKLGNERQSYESKISSLNQRLAEAQVQQDNIELKLPELSNSQLLRVKDLYKESKLYHQRQISELQKIILRKNIQIKTLLRQQSQRQQKIQQILINKNELNGQLQNEIAKIRKQNQQQVILLTNKIIASKDEEIKALKEQIKNMTEFCKSKENQLTKQQNLHREQLQISSQRHKEQIANLVDEINKHQKEISNLNNQLKEKNDKIIEITSQLSLQKQKTQHNSQQGVQYENGIVFLERQLRRAEQKIQQKNRLYSNLQSDLQAQRKLFEAQLVKLNEKISRQRNESRQKLAELQNHIKQLTEQLISKNQEINKLKQTYSTQKLSLQVEIRSTKFQLQQLENDYKRLLQIRKTLEEKIKNEREKSSNISYQRQKYLNIPNSNLESIYREKESRLLRNLQENKKLSNEEVKNLKERVNQLQVENSALKRAHQRLSNELQSNKQNGRLDEERKIATLDLEVALLGNIYHEFINSSSRNIEESLTNKLGLSRKEI